MLQPRPLRSNALATRELHSNTTSNGFRKCFTRSELSPSTSSIHPLVIRRVSSLHATSSDSTVSAQCTAHTRHNGRLSTEQEVVTIRSPFLRAPVVRPNASLTARVASRSSVNHHYFISLSPNKQTKDKFSVSIATFPLGSCFRMRIH